MDPLIHLIYASAATRAPTDADLSEILRASRRNNEEMGAATGHNDFFAQASCFERLDAGRARKLLGAFRTGRWRSRLGATPGLAADARRSA